MKIPNFLNALEVILKDNSAKKKEQYKDYPYFHNPSSATLRKPDGSLVGACLRQLWYRATKTPESEPINITSSLQALFGDCIHKGLLDLYGQSKDFRIMKESGGKFVIDTLTKEVSYRIDGIVSQEEDMGGLELKTTQGRALTGPGWGIRDKGPKEDHLLQVICYMKAQPSLKWFALVYVARDDAYRMQFNITRKDDEFFLDGVKIKDLNFTGIEARWKELESHIKNNTVPPRDYKVFLKPDGTIAKTKTVGKLTKKSDFRCLYCAYSSLCWSQSDASKDAYK